MADNLTIKIGADSKEAQEELDRLSSSVENWGDTVASIGKVAAAAFAAVSGAITYAVHEFSEAEKVSNRTNAVLKATGGIAGVTAAEVARLATSLQKETTFSDEAIQSAENILLRFTEIGQDVFPKATEAVLDLATQMGGDASAAAESLGRALQNPAEGVAKLQRAGILFSETQRKQIEYFTQANEVAKAQDIILKQIQSTAGGLASNEATSLAGTLLQVKNAFSDVAESVGGKFAPYIKAAAVLVKDFLLDLKESDSTASQIARTFSAIAAISAFASAIAGVTAAVNALNVGFAALLANPAFLTIAGIATGLTLVAAVTAGYYNTFKQAYEEAHKTRIVDAKRADEARANEEFAKAKHDQKIREANEKAIQDKDNADKAAKARAAEAEAQSFQYRILQLEGFSGDWLSKVKELNDLERQIEAERGTNREQNLIAIRDRVLEQLQEQNEQILAEEQSLNDAMALVLDQRDQELVNRNQQLYLKIQADTRNARLNEKTAHEQFIRDQVKAQIGFNNDRLLEAQKYNKAYAEINYFLRATEVGQSLTFFTTLQSMTQSHNQTLKSIGKAAALTQIGIDTARGATQALSAFPIPFIGPALGMAAAAAIVAFGIERSAQVLAANQGGLVTGGIAGMDSVPAMLTPGELVVPQQNFDEVINSVIAARTGSAPSGGSGSFGGSDVRVLIDLTQDASQLITAKQIEDSRLGLSRA